MNQFPRVCGFAIVLLMGAVAAAETPNEQADTVTIPLDQIWAYEMPGTRQMSIVMKGDPLVYESPDGPLVQDIVKSLPYLIANKGEKAGAAFAVSGTGMVALRQAHSVLVGKQDAPTTVSSNSEVTVVFFSHNARRYVFLEKVERRNGTVEIRYRVVPHMTSNTSVHFALIPLGKLPVGTVSVNMIRSPLGKTFADQGVADVTAEWDRRVVCRSFSFSVVDQGSEKDGAF